MDSGPEDSSNVPPVVVPDHDLLRVIGRGSYGEVWLARNRIGQLRAVKIVRRAAFKEAGPFEREFKGVQCFEPVSRSHEGLVDILQVGGNDEAFYYVMELADAAEPRGSNQCSVNSNQSPAVTLGAPLITDYSPRTLRSGLKAGRLPAAEVIELGAALTGALAHLHRAGLVHRDIKPSNVIFVDGVPKLADIGLVVETGEARSFVGTEGFIPPEGPGTPQADVYGLGKLLYEVSTGKDRHDYPEPITELGELTDREAVLELNAIIHRACQPDATARYASAAEMERDFSALREGRSIRARHRWGLLGVKLRAKTAWAVIAALVAVLGWSFTALNRERSRAKLDRPEVPPEAVALIREAEKASPTTKAGFEKSLELCHRAMALAPAYADAHVVLANAYREAAGWHRPERQAMIEARQAAQRALQLDPQNAGAHVQLGLVQMLHEWDFAKAETSFQAGLALERTNAWHLVAYADLLRSLGRLSEARRLVEEAVKLGVSRGSFGSMNHLTDHALQFHAERNFDGMLEQARQMRTAQPESILSQIYAGLAHAGAGRFREALTEFGQARVKEDAPDLMALAAYCHGRLGERAEALALLKRLDDFAPVVEVSPYYRAYVFAGIGAPDEVFAQLELALEQRSSHLVGYSWRGLLEDAIWDPFHGDPRWKDLVERVGLRR